MLARLLSGKIAQLAKRFPIVLIVGPRQCGKTTLVREFVQGEYFDLERPSDRQLFDADVELAVGRIQGSVIIDEAQVVPQLFPVLRSLVDSQGRTPGKFILLGSVNPLLLREVSESLAGRVGIAELTPFIFSELVVLNRDLSQHWLRGGFPDACQAPSLNDWLLWMENYTRTFVERDIMQVSSSVSASLMRRLFGLLAHHHGGLLNASDIGRALGLSYHTINNYVDLIEAHFLVRRLVPYHANVGKRLVKAPKIYVRDSGLAHYFLGIHGERQLLESPSRGRSFEGYMIEQIIAREQAESVGSQFYFYRTHAGAEIDLIIDRGLERLGFEFKTATSTTPRDWANLSQARQEGIIHHGYVVNLGGRSFSAAPGVDVLSAEQLLRR